jgi:hypothetical protein
MAKAKVRKSRSIVVGHLEKINSKVFDRYQKQITDLIKGNYGVYALYRRDKLYYIGMATDFKRRIKQHLRDRLKGKWNHFSLYLLRRIDHLREIEALLVRIAEPGGNKQRGTLGRSKNLGPQLKRILTADSKKVIDEILESGRKKKKKVKRTIKKGKTKKGEIPLKGYLRDWQRIYAGYKGKEYKGKVLPSGRIKYDGRLYNSPTAAAQVIVDRRTVNGWRFWKYKDKRDKLVPIANLRVL